MLSEFTVLARSSMEWREESVPPLPGITSCWSSGVVTTMLLFVGGGGAGFGGGGAGAAATGSGGGVDGVI